MSNQEEFLKCKICGYSSWYQEGTGEGALRCCRHCGFILTCHDRFKPRPEVDLSKEEAAAFRRRAGVPEDQIESLLNEEDPNRELGERKKQRRLYGGAAFTFPILVLCFRHWLFEPCETRQQAISFGLFLLAVWFYMVFRSVYAQMRIWKIEPGSGRRGKYE